MTVENANRRIIYLFDCVSSLAKLGSSKPGPRSEQERITPSVDRSTVGNAQREGLSQYRAEFNTPLKIKAGWGVLRLSSAAVCRAIRKHFEQFSRKEPERSPSFRLSLITPT